MQGKTNSFQPYFCCLVCGGVGVPERISINCLGGHILLASLCIASPSWTTAQPNTSRSIQLTNVSLHYLGLMFMKGCCKGGRGPFNSPSPGMKLGPWSEFPFLFRYKVLLNSGGSNSPWSEFWSEFPHFMGWGWFPHRQVQYVSNANFMRTRPKQKCAASVRNKGQKKHMNMPPTQNAPV